MKLTDTEIKFLKNAIEELKRAEIKAVEEMNRGADLVTSAVLHYQYVHEEVFDEVSCAGNCLIDDANTYLRDVRLRRSRLESFLKKNSADEPELPC